MNDSVISQPQVSIGIASICTHLTNHSHKCLVFDTHYDDDTTILSEILNYEFDYVGFSTTEVHYNHAKILASNIRKCTNIPIVFGGVYPTLFPFEVIENDFIDFVCVGDGEVPLRKLLENSNKYTIKGLWHKNNNQILNSGSSDSFDVNSFCITDFSCFRKTSIVQERNNNGTSVRLSFISGGRGCQFSCAFCSNHEIKKIHRHKIRHRKVDNIISEIIDLQIKYKITEIFFTNENFLANDNFVQEFCRKYVASNIKIPFGVLSRPEHINNQTVSLLKKSGCIKIHMGIEVGNEQFRKIYLNRNISNSSIINSFKICKHHNIATKSFLMIGFFFERLSDLQETYDLALESESSRITCSIYYPLRGTKLGEIYYDANLVIKNNSILNYFDDSIIKHPTLSKSDLSNIRVSMLRAYPEKLYLGNIVTK